MTIVANITRDMGWRRYESKNTYIRVLDTAGDPVDLNGVTVRYVILRLGAPNIVKTTADDITAVAHADDTGNVLSVANIAWDFDEYATFFAGIYGHEMWDDDSHHQLVEGDVYLGEGTAPVPAP